MIMQWEVVARTTNAVIAQFATETAARDYARWRNDGRRLWKARRIGLSASASGEYA